MRTVDFIVIHNTQANAFKTPEKLAEDSGLQDCPYDYVVHPDGKLLLGRSLSKEGAHFYGGNSRSASIGVGGDFRNNYPTYAAESACIRAIKLIAEQVKKDWRFIPIVSHHDAFIINWGQKDPRQKSVTDCGTGAMREFILNLKWAQLHNE